MGSELMGLMPYFVRLRWKSTESSLTVIGNLSTEFQQHEGRVRTSISEFIDQQVLTLLTGDSQSSSIIISTHLYRLI